MICVVENYGRHTIVLLAHKIGIKIHITKYPRISAAKYLIVVTQTSVVIKVFRAVHWLV